ncbi:MAG TPA: M20 family metallopeptidase [Polyangiales bacterium]
MTEPHDALSELLARLHAGQAELLGLIERLVRVNSYTRNIAGVDAVGELLAEALAGTSLRVAREQPDGLGTHLAFSTPAARRGAPILLIGHHDTVFPPGTFEGFRSEGGRAYGPGVLDMKGGLALIVAVLRTLETAGVLADLPLVFVSVSDEEIGSPSSQPLLTRLAHGARCALVFEAGRVGDKLITARRGSGHARVETFGRAAHAGNALAQGRNAIWTLARFIDEAQRAQFAQPGASLNVGLVRGGSARNTVPEHAECEIDLRFSDAEDEAGLRSLLEAARQRAEQDVPETRCELHWTTSRKPWARSAGSAALCATYAQHQRAAGLLAGEADVIGGGSDANTVGALGIPTLDGLGPRGSGFHTHAERIEIDSLPRKAEALLRFLLDAHKNERT